MHLRPFLVMTALATAALLSGCLIPEHFSAKIDIQPDASLDYSYEGTAIDPMAMLKMQRQGILSDKEQQSLAAEAQKLRQNPDVKKRSIWARPAISWKWRAAAKRASPSSCWTCSPSRAAMTGDDDCRATGQAQGESRPCPDGCPDKRQPARQCSRRRRGHISQCEQRPASGSGSYTWRIGEVGVRPEIKLRFNP